MGFRQRLAGAGVLPATTPHFFIRRRVYYRQRFANGPFRKLGLMLGFSTFRTRGEISDAFAFRWTQKVSWSPSLTLEPEPRKPKLRRNPVSAGGCGRRAPSLRSGSGRDSGRGGPCATSVAATLAAGEGPSGLVGSGASPAAAAPDGSAAKGLLFRAGGGPRTLRRRARRRGVSALGPGSLGSGCVGREPYDLGRI